MAESHKLILQNQQKQLDGMVKDAAILLLHDIKGAIVEIAVAAAETRRKLPRIEPDEIDRLLSKIQEGYEKVQSTAESGFPYLTTGVYQQMMPVDVLEHLVQWAAQQKPLVTVDLPTGISDFFIARAHPSLLTNVLANLYKNSRAAVRDDGKSPDVSLTCVVRNGDRPGEFLDVYFRDNGRGISGDPTSWPRLFHILKPKEEENSRGWGIGLPISRHILQLMEGDLQVESSVENQGTVMHLEFRLSDS
jgi:K+-sensing histidine kinase KdpD